MMIAAVPNVLPLPSTRLASKLSGSFERFTRPMFVRYSASDSMPVRYTPACRSASFTCGTAWPYVPALPVVKVRLVILRFGVDVVLCASMASAPAPLDMPKRSSSVFASVIDDFAPRNSGRVCTLRPAIGRKMNCPITDSLPALKIVSSVRHPEPPAPFVCATAETSERNGGGGARALCGAAALDDAEFAAVRLTGYVPGPAGAGAVTPTLRAVDDELAPAETVSRTLYVPAAP